MFNPGYATGSNYHTATDPRYKLKSIHFYLRPPIAPEASLLKSLSLNQLAKIFVVRGMRGDKDVADYSLSFSLVATSK